MALRSLPWALPNGLGQGFTDPESLGRLLRMSRKAFNIDLRLVSSVLLLGLVSVGIAPAARAQEGPTIQVQLGLYDVFEELEATEIGLEYTFQPRAFGLAPTIGAAYTSDETFLAYAGLRREFDLSRGWILTPGFAVAYWDQGSGKDLGLELEFRSSIELAWRVGHRDRLGLTLYHVSNSGFSERNPGANSLLLGWRRVLVR